MDFALKENQIREINKAGDNFLKLQRPPAGIRNQFDLAYRIEGQSVIVFEIKPRWDDPSEIMEHPVAKSTFVQTQNLWKVYWMRQI